MSKSKLIKLAYKKLYDDYDTYGGKLETLERLKDDKHVDEIKELKLNMKLIKEAVDEKSLTVDEKKVSGNFQPYPEYQDSQFQQIIYEKQEFNVNQLFLDTGDKDNACNAEFSIKGHQNFLKNFMHKESPYRSLLIYHGVGVGKTCSALTIAENFRDPYARKEKRVLILSSKNIQIGWKHNIYDPAKEENQCTGDTFIHSGVKTEREVNKLVKQYYELMAYQSFSNFVKRLVKTYVQRFPKDQHKDKEKECIDQYFSNRYMVIDEVHNIRDDDSSEMRDTIQTIKKVITHSKNLRLVLLTATPMYNRDSEIIWILNMMLLNDGRPTIDKKDVFDKQGGLIPEGKKILENKSRGYISYLRGENPITFPIRLSPIQLKGTNRKPMYSPDKSVSIINKGHAPKLNLVGGIIQPKDEFSFLELYGSRLQKQLQFEVYDKAIQNLIDKDPDIDLDIRGELTPIVDNIMLVQVNNMVYPLDKDYSTLKQGLENDDITIDEFYGEKGLKNCMNKSGSKYTYKKNILDQYGAIFDKSYLKSYSVKINSILDAVDKSEGVVFIYTTYIHSGIIPLQLALEQNGYKKHTGDGILKYPEWSPSADKHTKREPISFDGKRRSQAGDSFQQANYMVIDGSTSKKNLLQQLKIVNSKENMNGEKIKVILGTVVASEGLDFKRIRSVHIMDPWLHLNRIEQTIGRAIRFCSHKDLPDNQKNVLIYLHTTILRNGRESIDTSIYRYAEKKSMQIGEIELILKKSAVDRYLYKDVNVINKGAIDKVMMQPPIRGSNEIDVSLFDSEFSKVCSYSNKCDYNKGLHISPVEQTNTDTFIDHYSSNIIHSIKKKISLLYTSLYVYDMDSIVKSESLHHTEYDLKPLIYTAIDEMVLHKYMIHDKYGNSGYLINKGIYYIFQPHLVDDESIPLYYRMNLHHLPKTTITLPRLNEVIDECNCSKGYLSENVNEIYEKIVTRLDNPVLVEVMEHMKGVDSIYKDLHINHRIVIEYVFDRLEFEDKCKLMYGYLKTTKFKYTFYDTLQSILGSLIIYRSTGTNSYYFNDELKGKNKPAAVFGFALSYHNKPCYYEYYNDDELIPCTKGSYNYINIDNSLKRYIKTGHYNQFKKSEIIWGYTITRKKKDFTYECVFKLVQPNDKGKEETNKYPPGPGNVCIENNLFSRREKLKSLIEPHYPALSTLFDDTSLNKGHLCVLLELVLRNDIKNTFYSYDKIWLKYL
jgi:superfamily II DNA or RNA helicase